MAKGGIIGDIVHSVGVRYRVRGSGELTVIANFQDQGVQISFRTISIDEVFNINKIICFVKPVAESYPIRSGG